MLDKNDNKQYAKRDEPMNQSASSSSQPPPPPAPPVNIILKPNGEEELNNSQPGRAKQATANEPKRRGRPVEVKLALRVVEVAS